MNDIYCGKCNIQLEDKKTGFSYLGHEFHATVPCCPRCGQVYIDEDLVQTKISEVEMALEDK